MKPRDEMLCLTLKGKSKSLGETRCPPPVLSKSTFLCLLLQFKRKKRHLQQDHVGSLGASRESRGGEELRIKRWGGERWLQSVAGAPGLSFDGTMSENQSSEAA